MGTAVKRPRMSMIFRPLRMLTICLSICSKTNECRGSAWSRSRSSRNVLVRGKDQTYWEMRNYRYKVPLCLTLKNIETQARVEEYKQRESGRASACNIRTKISWQRRNRKRSSPKWKNSGEMMASQLPKNLLPEWNGCLQTTSMSQGRLSFCNGIKFNYSIA